MRTKYINVSKRLRASALCPTITIIIIIAISRYSYSPGVLRQDHHFKDEETGSEEPGNASHQAMLLLTTNDALKSG